MTNEQNQYKFTPIKKYKGFIISESKYIEELHPQYNYLAFEAKNDIGQWIEVVFHDIDMRIMTYDELLNLFLKRVDYFIKEINYEQDLYIKRTISKISKIRS